jgi:hypothetical protein
MALATTDLFWLRMLFKDLGISTPCLWCDNIGVLTLLRTLFIMLGPSTSKSTITSFVRRCLMVISPSNTLARTTNLPTFLLRASVRHDFSYYVTSLWFVPSPSACEGSVNDISATSSHTRATSTSCPDSFEDSFKQSLTNR